MTDIGVVSDRAKQLVVLSRKKVRKEQLDFLGIIEKKETCFFSFSVFGVFGVRHLLRRTTSIKIPFLKPLSAKSFNSLRCFVFSLWFCLDWHSITFSKAYKRLLKKDNCFVCLSFILNVLVVL